MKKLPSIIVIVLLALGGLFVLFHETILETLKWAGDDKRPVLASVEKIEGDVTYKKAETVKITAAHQGLTLKHQDNLVTTAGAEALLRFSSGLLIKLVSESEVVVEKSNDQTIINIISGDISVVEKGTTNGDVLISKDGILQDPLGRPAPAPMSFAAGEKLEENIKKTESSGVSDENSLTDEYIASVIRSQKSFLGKCYSQFLQGQPAGRGRLFMTFTIQPRGQIHNIKIMKSTFKDTSMEKCVSTVLSRAKFKAFNGDPIIVNYPFAFE